MQVLAVRVQLLHTALFAFLHPKSTENDYEQLVELFSSEKYYYHTFLGRVLNSIFMIDSSVLSQLELLM